MFLSCNIGTFTKTECGSSTHYPNDQSLVCLSQCDRDILGHLSSLKLGSGQNQADVDVPSEGHLIARRAGLFNYNSSLSVCPRHRYNLGIYWRTKKTCQYPSHTGKARPCRSVTSVMSMAIWNKQTCLVPVGSGICKKCVNIFKSDVPDFSVYETSMVQSGNFQQYEFTYTTDIQLSEDEKKTESYNLRERKQSSYKDSFDESALLDQQCSQQSHVESEGDLSSSSQVSSWSQENLDTVVDEFNTAVITFSHVQISPLKYRVRRNLDDLKPSTLRSIKRKATETVNLFLEAIAPGQSHKLLKMIQDNDAADATENPDSLQKMVVALYMDSSDRSTKKQLLSMISTLHTKSQLQQLIPGLTTYAIDEARKHASTVGAGIPLPSKEVFTRQRIDKLKLDHALDFFFDPTFHQVSSFGTKEVKLSSGEILQIPEVVRTACHSTIVDTYISYCAETDFEPLSRATLFKILSECPASHRTNLKGLDNITADGVCAMDSLLDLVKNLQGRIVDQRNQNFIEFRENLLSYKLYLKTDYKHHIQLEDSCADHCIAFALSDPTETKLKRPCINHSHDMQCPRCCLLPDAIKELKKLISEFTDVSEEEKIEILTDVDIAVAKIADWKSRILRCVNQDRSRLHTLESLADGNAMLVLDWAMKFLPLLHREKQSDFFGQKGFSWHVAVLIYKENETSTLKHRTFVHTMESAKQDWFSVASVIEHVLSEVKKQMPNISTVVLRSDNAGCYHCSNLWHSLHGISQRTDVYIQAYNFSEAQNGKSYCDSKIAHMRGKMKKIVCEGGNIKSSSDMKSALDMCGGVSGCQVANVFINTDNQTKDQSQLKGITKFSNVKIGHDGNLTCWKAFDIGEGVQIPMSSFNQGPTNLSIMEDFSVPKQIEGCIKNSIANVLPQDQDVGDSGNLYCPEATCSCKFTSYSDLEDHIFLGKHKMIPTHDIVKQKWKDVCLEVSSCSIKSREASLLEGISSVNPGWALKRERKSARFSLKVRNYLKEVFESGEKSGQKANANIVVKHMRSARDSNGKKLFSPHEYLQPSQIISYFSRLVVLTKTPKKVPEEEFSEEDLESAIVLINKAETLEELL